MAASGLYALLLVGHWSFFVFGLEWVNVRGKLKSFLANNKKKTSKKSGKRKKEGEVA